MPKKVHTEGEIIAALKQYEADLTPFFVQFGV
jgi:hypothetical protein